MSQVDPATDPQVAFKRAAAVRAVEFVQSGMKLGLGTGSTAIYATRRIGEMLDSGELRDIVAFATSKGTLAEAVRLGIPMLPDDLPCRPGPDDRRRGRGRSGAECHQGRRRRAAA